jgi:STE24 endopeptidase
MNLTLLILIILISGFILERILDYLNFSRWSDQVPDDLKDLYDQQAYKKAQNYDKANKRLSLISDTLSLSLVLIMIFTGSFGRLDDWAVETAGQGAQSMLLFFGVIAVFSEVINLPFAVYQTFVIEEQFGFNKTTPRLFISDRIKGYIIAVLLLGGMIYLFSSLHDFCGVYFWLYAWVAFSVVMVFMSAFYTSIILPLFNKLKPLEEGELRDKISQYCSKTGFGLADVLVMDGSKRSRRANAFFSGIGGRKKIVLFDTLIKNHTVPELVSVLAHETGHYKLRHTLLGLVMSILHVGLMLFIFSFFLENAEVHHVFGGCYATLELGLLAFGILYSPVSMAVSVLMNLMSRKHEFEADSYAARTSNPEAMKEALKKLSVMNLSNLDPHPAYVFFYYSHPPLMARLKAIDKVSNT